MNRLFEKRRFRLSINLKRKANCTNAKVSVKPLGRFADSKGRAFGRFPQKAESFCLKNAGKGEKTVRWTVFEGKPSSGVSL